MSYAQAAGTGASSGSNSGSQSKDKFYDEKMVVCLIKGCKFRKVRTTSRGAQQGWYLESCVGISESRLQ